MMELYAGQILAIFFLALAMAYMVGGKSWSARVARWHLKQVRKMARWCWRQAKAFLKWALNLVAGRKARAFYWRSTKSAMRRLGSALRWVWTKIRP